MHRNLFVTNVSEYPAKIAAIIAENESHLDEIFNSTQPRTWDTLMLPLDDMKNRLQLIWLELEHRHNVMETDEVREVYKKCLEMVNDHKARLMQNKMLYEAMAALKDSSEYNFLDDVQKSILKKEFQRFLLAGANLNDADKVRFNELKTRLSSLQSKFMENVNDATKAWVYQTDDLSELDGLSYTAKMRAEEKAKQAGKSGWVLTIDAASYMDVIDKLKNRELRKRLYEAFYTVASDKGPNAGKFDSTPLMEEIIRIRHEIATMLGFTNYAAMSLSQKMVGSSMRVMEMINSIIPKVKRRAEEEIDKLKKIAKTLDNIDELALWDVAYYSEKLLQQTFGFKSDDLRSYFSEQSVLAGLFDIFHKLFNIHISEKPSDYKWDENVKYFEVTDENNQVLGGFFIDFYFRDGKMNGPGFNYCLQQRKKLSDGSIQLPIVVVVCNLNPPVLGAPSLLSFDEVRENVFHELGHCLQFILAQSNYVLASGLDSIPWDAVELPSNFLEYLVKNREIFTAFGKHYESGDPIPEDLADKLLGSVHFQKGIELLSYLQRVLFDMLMHTQFDPEKSTQVHSFMDAAQQQTSVMPAPDFNRSQNRFRHGFSGTYGDAYAAGYYSYLWSDILATNVLERFEQASLLDADLGAALKKIIQTAGWRDAFESFLEFNGALPSLDPYFAHEGFTTSAEQAPLPRYVQTHASLFPVVGDAPSVPTQPVAEINNSFQ